MAMNRVTSLAVMKKGINAVAVDMVADSDEDDDHDHHDDDDEDAVYGDGYGGGDGVDDEVGCSGVGGNGS